jgi:hypothetical protein
MRRWMLTPSLLFLAGAATWLAPRLWSGAGTTGPMPVVEPAAPRPIPELFEPQAAGIPELSEPNLPVAPPPPPDFWPDLVECGRG